MEAIKLLDHGFVRFVEAWGHGDAGTPDMNQEEFIVRDGMISANQFKTDYECGIIEAARQSTQASFRGWEDRKCKNCNGTGSKMHSEGSSHPFKCPECEGQGIIRGDERLLKYLFCNKPPHATPFEFAGMVIEVRAPIFVFREWHRHRVQSQCDNEWALDNLDDTAFNEMSARYASLPDMNYVPTTERCLMNSVKNKQAGVIKGAEELNLIDAGEFREELENMYIEQEKFYQKWLKKGVPKELARIDLPVGRYSQMRAQTSLRNWLAFITLRSDPGAMWEIQQYSNAVGTIIEKVFPRTWKLFQLGRTT